MNCRMCILADGEEICGVYIQPRNREPAICTRPKGHGSVHVACRDGMHGIYRWHQTKRDIIKEAA